MASHLLTICCFILTDTLSSGHLDCPPIHHLPLPRCPDLTNPSPQPVESISRRNFAEAVVQCCQSIEASDIEKEKNAWIIDKIELEPIALMEESDSVGKAEYNALT